MCQNLLILNLDCWSYLNISQGSVFLRHSVVTWTIGYNTGSECVMSINRVAERSAENQMTAHNLAIVFGPTLMWSSTPTELSLSTTVVLQGRLVEYFITDRQQLFTAPL